MRAFALATVLCAGACGGAATTNVDMTAPPDLTPINKTAGCVMQFGSALTNAFGRLDGTVVAIAAPGDPSCPTSNMDHVLLEVAANGAVYREVVNVISDRAIADQRVRLTTTNAALNGPGYAPGWHTDAPLDYANDLGMHADPTAALDEATLSQRLIDAVTIGGAVSVYSTSSGGDSAHLVHRNAPQSGPARRRARMGASPIRSTMASLILAALAATYFFGCKTRPYTLHDKPTPSERDLGVVIDLAIADLHQDPDLLPPPDLTLPFICRNVYVVDSSTLFSSFDTKTLSFVDIGFLSCSTLNAAAPFSMAVGRDGNAYVLYNDGELFKVNPQDATCEPTKFKPNQNGFQQFGMGFSADQPGGQAETLFIGNDMQLGSIEFPALTTHRIGASTSWPELTGTADAELWAFYPDESESSVSQLDKTNGARIGKTIPLLSLSGAPQSWAFAFWGGSFWIFLSNQGETTSVYQLDRQTGQLSTALANTGRQIVGAGVSSCAPTGLE